VKGAAEAIIEEVMQAHHAKACVMQLANVV
jgi:hypothetical protein